MPSVLAGRAIDQLVRGILAIAFATSAALVPHGVLAAPADPDHDGLTTGFERTWSHTDPQRADTDGDGIPDGREEPDHDHLTNIWEMRLGLDPHNRDTDHDGIRDDREDPDRDRLRNGFEIRWAGTDPRRQTPTVTGSVTAPRIRTTTASRTPVSRSTTPTPSLRTPTTMA